MFQRKTRERQERQRQPDMPPIRLCAPRSTGHREQIINALAAAVLAVARRQDAAVNPDGTSDESHKRPDAC